MAQSPKPMRRDVEPLQKMEEARSARKDTRPHPSFGGRVKMRPRRGDEATQWADELSVGAGEGSRLG